MVALRFRSFFEHEVVFDSRGKKEKKRGKGEKSQQKLRSEDNNANGTMDQYVAQALALPPDGQRPTLLGIALILGLGKGGVPGLATGVDDRFLILEHAQAQETLSEIEPKPFDRIELGAIGRQRDQGDVVRDLKCVSAMPASLVEHHDGMLVFGQGLGKLGEEDRHR